MQFKCFSYNIISNCIILFHDSFDGGKGEQHLQQKSFLKCSQTAERQAMETFVNT